MNWEQCVNTGFLLHPHRNSADMQGNRSNHNKKTAGVATSHMHTALVQHDDCDAASSSLLQECPVSTGVVLARFNFRPGETPTRFPEANLGTELLFRFGKSGQGQVAWSL